MSDVVCDASSIISLATNCLLWVLGPLGERMGGEFVVPPSVRVELIDRPLMSSRYRFEAIRVARAIEEGSLRILDDRRLASRVSRDAAQLQTWANSIFALHGPGAGRRSYAQLLHIGEAEALALTRLLGTDLLLVDEKTTRFLVEDPLELVRIIERRSRSRVRTNEISLKRFSEACRDVRILRSSELAMAGYELGLFSRYMARGVLRTADTDLVSGLLHAIRNSGCAIGSAEIDEYVALTTGVADAP